MDVPVIVMERTRNDKLGDMSTTYVTQETCPTSCVFKDNGCYAERGFVGIHSKRLNRFQRVNRYSLRQLANMEASMIDTLSGRRRLRAHVVGDCRDAIGASVVGAALVRHEQKHGQRSWTYTHAWRDIEHPFWAGARVLASCETLQDLREADARGYACTTTIGLRANHERKWYEFHEFTVIPCPAQFYQPNGQRQTTCQRCNLCSDVDRNWARKTVVGFQPDGRTDHKVLQLPLQLERANADH